MAPQDDAERKRSSFREKLKKLRRSTLDLKRDTNSTRSSNGSYSTRRRNTSNMDGMENLDLVNGDGEDLNKINNTSNADNIDRADGETKGSEENQGHVDKNGDPDGSELFDEDGYMGTHGLEQIHPHYAPLDEEPQINVTYSVFFGNPIPSNPILDHFLLKATTSERFMSIGQITKYRYETPRADGLNPGDDISVLRILAGLAVRYNEQILELPPRRCCVCDKPSPEAAVHRPLFASLDGYSGKKDGAVLHPLMRYIAKHAPCLDSKEKMASALGETGNGPYLHELAASVCSKNAECFKIVKRNMDKFIDASMEKGVGHLLSKTDLDKHIADLKALEDKELGDDAMVYVNEAGWELVDNDDNDEQKELFPDAASFIESGTVAAPNELVKFRLSVFCGRPILDPNAPARRGRISSLVFTSKWPSTFAPGVAGRPYEQEYQNYRLIAGFHNKHILQSAEFMCVMCNEEKPATELVHHLISFKKDNSVGPEVAELKKCVMRLFQFVAGRWSYPDMNAAWSQDGRCHINEWVVPVCGRNTSCERLAKIAVKEAMNNLMPEDVKPKFLNVYPDTLFSRPLSRAISGAYPKLTVMKLAAGIVDFQGEVMKEPAHQDILTKEASDFYNAMRGLVDAEKEKRLSGAEGHGEYHEKSSNSDKSYEGKGKGVEKREGVESEENHGTFDSDSDLEFGIRHINDLH
ncbi:hypothetical protein FQN54_004821 [Arachnomyces sp. PD_36]|nr:hypothetical protein FQN54_004821 [Arachnomyces sp. PD_36]